MATEAPRSVWLRAEASPLCGGAPKTPLRENLKCPFPGGKLGLVLLFLGPFLGGGKLGFTKYAKGESIYNPHQAILILFTRALRVPITAGLELQPSPQETWSGQTL